MPVFYQTGDIKIADVDRRGESATGADSFKFNVQPQQVGLLLPAVQVAREAARRTADEDAPDDLKWHDNAPLTDDVAVDGCIITAEDWF